MQRPPQAWCQSARALHVHAPRRSGNRVASWLTRGSGLPTLLAAASLATLSRGMGPVASLADTNELSELEPPRAAYGQPKGCLLRLLQPQGEAQRSCIEKTMIWPEGSTTAASWAP